MYSHLITSDVLIPVPKKKKEKRKSNNRRERTVGKEKKRSQDKTKPKKKDSQEPRLSENVRPFSSQGRSLLSVPSAFADRSNLTPTRTLLPQDTVRVQARDFGRDRASVITAEINRKYSNKVRRPLPYQLHRQLSTSFLSFIHPISFFFFLAYRFCPTSDCVLRSSTCSMLRKAKCSMGTAAYIIEVQKKTKNNYAKNLVV
jgi:hypothetical protein